MNQPKEWRYTWVYMVKDGDVIVHIGTGYTTIPAPPTDRNLKSLSDAAALSVRQGELRGMPGQLILTITGAIPIYDSSHDVARVEIVGPTLADSFFSKLGRSQP